MPRTIHLFVLSCAMACGGPARPDGPTPLPAPALLEDAYVWQRAWTPAVVDAVRARGPQFHGIRFLAAELEDDGAVFMDAQAHVSARPLVAVVRVDGSMPPEPGELARVVDDVVERLQGQGLVGVEIDHDCASSKLRRYAGALAEVKRGLGPLRLSITALPSWTHAAALPDVLAVVDEAVLQVHSVDAPHLGLFSPARAKAAVEAFAAMTNKPFRVAVPAYGHALLLDDSGRVIGVESEEPRAPGNARVRELWAEPRDVSAFLDAVRAQRPPHLVGLVWFRLPVDGDTRAWSPETLARVRRGEQPPAKLRVERVGQDVVLVNEGLLDEAAPSRVTLEAGNVTAADGVQGYAWDDGAFVSQAPPRLRPGERKVIGWAVPAEARAKEVHRDP